MSENKETLVVKQVSDKVSRKVLCYSEALMMVEFCFKQGGVGEP